MEREYTFRRAEEKDADRIWEIIGQAKAQMYREKKQQWNESYPAPANIAADIGSGYGYVLCGGEEVIAYGAVIFDGEPAYRTIQGEWLSGDRPYVVVHRLAVAEEMKRRGVAVVFMQGVERLSLGRSVRSFRVDTNFDNFYMHRILEKLGFAYCGEITYQQGARMAYEKIL